jgi:hypothetical protein
MENGIDIKNISIENNRDLYEKEKINESLKFAKTIINSDKKEKTNIHYYWRVPREFGYKQQSAIISSIVNHDLDKVKIILWSNIDLKSNLYFQEINQYVENRLWDPEKEAEGTPLENSHIFKNTIDDSLCWLGGDLFRLLCLYKYGGVYSDVDVLFLRDITPLTSTEFMYQWGTSGVSHNESRLEINGAIMHLNKGSELATQLIKQLEVIPPLPNTNMWGKDLYQQVRSKNKNWNIFPCAWFNTEWVTTELNSFKKVDDTPLYDGAFTWHWHNKWDDPIESGSKFDILDTIIRDKFSNLR